MAAMVIGMVACATPYQPMGFRGGYAERPMGQGQFFVRVEVNGYTSLGLANEYLYRRANELCLRAGYRGFAVSGAASDSSVSAVMVGDNVQLVQKPDISALVTCNMGGAAR